MWLLMCLMPVLSAVRMSARGDEFSFMRIAFWGNGVGKKTLMAEVHNAVGSGLGEGLKFVDQ